MPDDFGDPCPFGQSKLSCLGAGDGRQLRLAHALPAPGALRLPSRRGILSRLVLAHESRQAPGSVEQTGRRKSVPRVVSSSEE
jgi:hypothetical protein